MTGDIAFQRNEKQLTLSFFRKDGMSWWQSQFWTLEVLSFCKPPIKKCSKLPRSYSNRISVQFSHSVVAPTLCTSMDCSTPGFPDHHRMDKINTNAVVHRRRQWHPTPVLLPGKSHGRRSLVGCSQWGCKESDTTQQLHFHSSLSCIGEGNGNPLQCCCLENPRDGEAWWAAIYGVAQCRTWLKWLSNSNSKFRLRRWLDWAYVFNQQYCRFSPQLQSPY